MSPEEVSNPSHLRTPLELERTLLRSLPQLEFYREKTLFPGIDPRVVTSRRKKRPPGTPKTVIVAIATA